ncbi:UPF0146 family protein [Methanocaldococcus infernus]
MNSKVIAEYILNNVKEDYKVYEFGIGFNYEVALILNEFVDLCVVDINERAIYKAKSLGLKGIVDNLFKPRFSYEDANLIYTIRPPLELVYSIVKIAKDVNAKLIIRPLSNEYMEGFKIKNYKGEFFYLMP